MTTFLNDFEAGQKENRHITAELPNIPFNKGRFDLALSSHFLFLYSDIFSLNFHINAINETLRVSNEVPESFRNDIELPD